MSVQQFKVFSDCRVVAMPDGEHLRVEVRAMGEDGKTYVRLADGDLRIDPTALPQGDGPAQFANVGNFIMGSLVQTLMARGLLEKQRVQPVDGGALRALDQLNGRVSLK